MNILCVEACLLFCSGACLSFQFCCQNGMCRCASSYIYVWISYRQIDRQICACVYFVFIHLFIYLCIHITICLYSSILRENRPLNLLSNERDLRCFSSSPPCRFLIKLSVTSRNHHPCTHSSSFDNGEGDSTSESARSGVQAIGRRTTGRLDA